MLYSTTPTIEGHPIKEYKGVVASEVIIGANAIKDFFAGITDFFGGRSGSYEGVMIKARDQALEEICRQAENMGGNAIVGIDFDYETIGSGNSMIMVAVSGTAVEI